MPPNRKESSKQVLPWRQSRRGTQGGSRQEAAQHPSSTSPSPRDEMNQQLTIYDQREDEVSGLRLQLEASQEEVRRLEAVVRGRDGEMEALKARLERAMRTVEVQSKTIAVNPHRLQPLVPFVAPSLPRQPPSFVVSKLSTVEQGFGRSGAAPLQEPKVRAGVPMSAVRKDLSRVVPRGVHARGLPPASSAAAPAPVMTALTGALIVRDTKEKSFDFVGAVDHLFKGVRAWAQAFANVPTSMDAKLPEGLYQSFARYTHKSAVTTFLSSPSTRPYLITRHIINAITSEVLTIEIVRAYDAQVEQHEITSALCQMLPGVPHHELRAYVSVRAHAVSALMDKHDFLNWILTQSRHHAKAMFDNIAPLLSQDRSRASDELDQLYEKAYRLGVKMYSYDCNYKFDYVKHGQQGYYHAASMTSLDIVLKGTPREIQEQDWRVRCCVAPLVIMINLLEEHCKPKTARLAEVLLFK